ncbi:MAG TPA: hypothetical protein VK084_05500 [Chitinophagaceae bacterium]|nr:hypothetical protein [Chitinophagaceae bacterium]
MKRIIKVSAFCLGLGLFAVGCGSANQTQQKDYPSMQQNVPEQNVPEQNNQLNQRNNQMNRPQQQTPRPQPTPTQHGGMNGGAISH